MYKRQVRYRNVISDDEGLAHPFRVEVSTLFADVEARANALLDEAIARMDGEQRRETGYDNADIDAIDASRLSRRARLMSMMA